MFFLRVVDFTFFHGSFQSSYPSWEPSSDGKQFFSTLKTFKEQKFREQGIRPGYISPNQTPQWAPIFQGQGDPNSYFSREMGPNISRSAYQLDCLWLIDPVYKNHPYILDWYYTSFHHHNPQDIESGAGPVDVDMWDPPELTRDPVQYDDNWGSFFEDRNGSNLEASTSAPLLRGSVLQHRDSSNMGTGPTGRSHWWARGVGLGPGPQTSFLEPPNFNRNDDNYSDRSFEDSQPFDWRRSNRLSKTFYMDNDEEGKFDLPFDDIYDRHSESPPNT